MPLFLVRHTLKKKGLPLLNLVGAKTISDKLSDISADNQSISYRYRFIDDHSGSMSKLAAVFGNQGKRKEAEQIYRQTLELNETEKVPSKEHLDTLSSKYDITFVSVMLLD